MASCQSQECCFKLRGDFFMRELPDYCDTNAVQTPKPRLHMGVIEEFGYTNLIKEFGSKDKTNSLIYPDACYTETYNGTELVFQIKCAKASILGMTAMAAVTALPAGTVTGKTFAATEVEGGALLPFAHSGASNIVVTAPAGAVAGVDYRITPSGIQVIVGSTVLIAGTAVTVNYSYPAQSSLQLGTALAKEYEIVFDGRNIMQTNTTYPTGKPFSAGFYKFKPNANKAVKILDTGNDVLTVELSGMAYTDLNKNPVPLIAGQVPSNVGYFTIVA